MPGTEFHERLAQLEVRVEEQGGRLFDISQQLRNMDQKFDQKFDDLRTELAKQFRWTLGVMLTLAGLIVALVRH